MTAALYDLDDFPPTIRTSGMTDMIFDYDQIDVIL
jgi:hypothetical protein